MTPLNDSYFTIDHPASGVYKDKGSKFLAFAIPVHNEPEIKEKVEAFRKEYFDARHHCYAYRLGADKSIFRTYDDGEPSGTAGKPIFGQIQSHDLTDILILVVRYFGGTLLGTSGLIRAYKAACEDALANAPKVQKFIYNTYKLTFTYENMNTVMKIIKDFDLQSSEHFFQSTCSIKINIKRATEQDVLSRIALFREITCEKVLK